MRLILENEVIIDNPTESEVLLSLKKFVSLENAFVRLEIKGDDILQVAYDNDNRLWLERHNHIDKLHVKSVRERIPRFELEKIFLDFYHNKSDWDRGIKWIKFDGSNLRKDLLDNLSIVSSFLGLISLGLIIYFGSKDHSEHLQRDDKLFLFLISVLFLPFAINNIRKWKVVDARSRIATVAILFLFTLFFVALL